MYFLTGFEACITSHTRIYPESADYRADGPIHAPLSIVDASFAFYTTPTMVWFFDEAPPTELLVSSLRQTLNAYPQWCGHLHFAKYNPQGDHTERHGRLMLSYGTDSDPGVELITAQTSHHISTIIPSHIEDYCDVTNMPFRELINGDTHVKPPESVHVSGLPGMVMQLTRFGCGGVSIGIRIEHSLADAPTLVRFITDWAKICSSLVNGTLIPLVSPVFNPQLLDSIAAGNINAQNADKDILRRSRLLPLHRYDSWASDKNLIPSKIISDGIPPGIIPPSPENLGKPLPWKDWDSTIPVSHCVLYFSPTELRNIWRHARSQGDRVSHADALLAHLWALIIRARGIEDDEEHFLDVPLVLRNRVDPQLPSSFLGSPVLFAAVTSTGREGQAQAIDQLARSIRSAVSKFTPKSIPELLHEMIFEITPQRRRNTFMGRQHTMVTSWLGAGVYDIDFGTGRPKYAHDAMSLPDGWGLVKEAGGGREGGAWHDKGVHVSLYFREDVMSEILKDTRLRQYRKRDFRL